MTPAKDFYKILDVPMTASQEEIKRAYRLLAFKYHPDVNAGGKATENWFREIHEAYRVLGDSDRRSVYNQERWYRESTVSGKSEAPGTPEELFQKMLKLSRYTRTLDRDRTNYGALQQYLLHLLNDENLQMLNQWNNVEMNLRIASELIFASAALSYKRFLPVAEKLRQLTPGTFSETDLALREKKRAAYWKKWQFPIVLLVALLLCLLIYLAGR